MKTKFNSATLTIALAVFGTQSTAFAWGSYGHEQVNAAALDLLPEESIGHQCLSSRNRDLMVRYAITPDADWKMLPYESRALKLQLLFQDPDKPASQATLKKELEKETESKTKHMRPGLVEALKKDPKNRALLAQMKEDLKKSLTDMSIDVLEAKRIADRTEHSVHFWEADAFTKEMNAKSILELAHKKRLLFFPVFSSDKGFDKMLGAYTQARIRNAGRIAKLDPEKAKQSDLKNPSSKDVLAQGSAPWRIVQLYNGGIEELKRAKESARSGRPEEAQVHFKKALLLLGSMGHYVGDMGQPFHATLNYDGQASTPPQNGIHHNYETQILDDEAEAQGKPPQDKASGLWPDLGATHGKVVALAKTSSPSVNDEPKHIVQDVMTLVAGGYDMVTDLLVLHESARQQTKTSPDPLKPINSKGVQLFRTLKLQFGGEEVTVLESAEVRMADSAVLLARLWNSAVRKSGLTSGDLNSVCSNVSFDREFAVKNHPDPDYHQPMSDFNKY